MSTTVRRNGPTFRRRVALGNLRKRTAAYVAAVHSRGAGFALIRVNGSLVVTMLRFISAVSLMI